MLANLVILAIGITLVVAIARAAMPQPQFRIKLEHPRPRVVRGRVSADYLDTLAQIAADEGITRGTISGYVDNRVVRIRFSREFPVEVQQRLRNVWGVTR